ncbi:unnamed protein product [Sphagnum tenellum]
MYLSFLNDLKPLIVIRVRFTHAQPQDAAPLEQDMVDHLFHRHTCAHFLTLQLDPILFVDGMANNAQFLDLV